MPIAKLSIDMEARLANIEKDMARVSRISEDAAARIKGAFSGLTLVFTGLAGALSVGAIKGAFDKYVEGAAQLDDFSEKVGASVENLSKLAGVAKISGTDMGLLESGLVRLSAALSKADDEAKGAGKAFSLLGLDPEKLQAMDSAEALQAVADKFAELEDSSGKTALAMAIFGKSGAQLLPYLKDLAGTGDLVAKVTTQQAAAAEEYEKNLKRLEAAQGAVAKTIAAELLPAANLFVQSMVDMIRSSEGVSGAVKDMAKDGSIREWAIGAARAAAFVVDAFDGVARVAKITGASIAGIAKDVETLYKVAQIVRGFAVYTEKGRADLVEALKGRENFVASMNEGIAGTLAKPQFSQILEDNIARFDAMGAAADKAKKKVAFTLGGDGAGKKGGAAERARNFQDYDAMLTERIAKAIGDTDTVKAAELVRLLQKLDELAAAGLDPAIVEEIRGDLTGATKEAADEVAHLNGLLANTPTAQLQEMQSDMLFLTEALQKEYISESKYLEAVTARLEKTSDKAKEAGDTIEEFAKQAARNMQDALADFLFDPFKDGTDGMLKNFGVMIQKMIAQAVAADLAKKLFGSLVQGGEGDGLFGAALSGLSGLIPKFDVGTNYVPRDMLAIVHKGEAITPARYNPAAGAAPASGGGVNHFNFYGFSGDARELRESAGQVARRVGSVINGVRRYG